MSKRFHRTQGKGKHTGIKRARDNNWRDTRTSAQCLSYLCLSEHLSDMTFTFSADKRVKIPIHKFVLSMRSAVFEAMFYGSLSENGETVLIKDVEPEVMKVVLEYIYTDKVNIDGNNVLACLYTAKKYDLSGLVQQCSDYLENYIDETNVCTVHEQAVQYGMKSLQNKCLGYIIENATIVLSSPGFLKLSHATFLCLLDKDELAVGEIERFQAAVKWAKHQCETRQMPIDGQNMRMQLGEALFQIRFPVMPIEEFARVVDSSGILTKDELLMMYQYNANKGSTSAGRFRKQERLGAPVTVDISRYIITNRQCLINLQDNTSRLSIQGHFSQQQPVRKAVKIYSITGTFLQGVHEITVRGTNFTDFEKNGDKIIFIKPIDISENLVIVFKKRCSSGFIPAVRTVYETIIKENINGQSITIKIIPDDLKNITFV